MSKVEELYFVKQSGYPRSISILNKSVIFEPSNDAIFHAVSVQTTHFYIGRVF
ncbi:MAG: hypothetical protein ACRCZA_06205 [Shewanella sp.]|uniref:hypothetical protein n=1 Tax=Shewanella sp. TaxID=50422 RepID=UPI003F2F908F